MYSQLKQEIKEIIGIVNECPDTLKVKCFEILLENYLSSSAKKSVKPKEAEVHEAPKESEKQDDTSLGDHESSDNEEISMKDFHVKNRKFLESNKISIDSINEIYYKEEGKLMPLYDSVKSTKMAECQIRLALLTAFENAFTEPNGEMSFNGEVIKKKCQDMKCYDSKNFASILKNYANLFVDSPDKYSKSFVYELSTDGKKELANVLRDLAKGE